ncbi:TetR/AcrR family transcriptional regulator [Pseudarthrobacter defluvii]|uniref:TetR/AcrR family transcriptional regulator n=1 Tax=Pseudarthrobacter defluvii TaxID=410837 RepID=UPI002576748E|nr:TetR/AcrR family transcriptional regulator [Pseudarthrobacter defluvii]WJH24753.1 TetR/AcrR family transcriptional regulator [Pseudarthrobacter defluvii]
MTSAGPGRPRHQQPSRPGATARDEILDAAAELFTTQGFASTSTRSIADAVGIRQSSLYHHFKTKDDILEDLLEGTVSGGLKFARAVAALPAEQAGTHRPAGSQLHAVALYDGTQLCSARWNLGVLYHLPEVRTTRFARFLSHRQELRRLYGELGGGLSATAAGPDGGDFTFRLVESLIYLRADGAVTAESALQAADAGLILCGRGDHLPAIRTASQALINQLA